MNTKRVLQLISVIGVVLFSTVLLISFLVEKPLEQAALGFIEQEINSQLLNKIDRLVGSKSMSLKYARKKFLKDYQNEVANLREDAKNIVSASVSCLSLNESISAAQLEQLVSSLNLKSRLWEFESIKTALSSMELKVQEKYHKVWNSLLGDIRYFAMINLASFVLLLLLSTYLVSVSGYFRLVSWLLVVATVCSILIYVFGQNWFYTILFDDYYGTGYFMLFGVIFLYLLYEGTINLVLIQVFGKRSKNSVNQNQSGSG